MRTLLWLIMFALAACASRAWYKDGSTERDFVMDKGQCNAQAYSVSNPEPVQRVIVFRACMEGKGWTYR